MQKNNYPILNLLVNYISKSIFIFAIFFFSLIEKSNAQGFWEPVTSLSPETNTGVMLLLSDGTVMCLSASGGATYGNLWYRLSPDSFGSYVHGNWSAMPSMHDTRLYCSSRLLKDGRVYIAGGEYGTGNATGEIFDPVSNVWTMAPVQTSTISDANSEILEDGRILEALVNGSYDHTLIFNPDSNIWSNGPTCLGPHDESTWLKLPDNSILFVEASGTHSERYIPSQNQWIADAVVPFPLYDSYIGETGGGVLLPDGRAFFLGANGKTAYYTPSGNLSHGSWTAGPDIPMQNGTPDAPAAMMGSGKILCAVSPVPTATNFFPDTTYFYEYDYLTDSFSQITAPDGSMLFTNPCYQSNMLDLPDGSVLYSQQGSSQYYVYVPDDTFLTAGKPLINSIYENDCNHFTLTGKRFNGISEGATYGDDWQMATNYPLVRLKSGNKVYYARTFNWNSTGVQRGNSADTVQFRIPLGLPGGTYSLEVVANGISSDTITFIYNQLLTSTTTPPSICSNTLFTYTPTSNVPGATFTWTRESVTGISNLPVTTPQTIDPNEVLINTTGNTIDVVYLYVITTSACTDTELVTVAVQSLPVTSLITALGPTTFCDGGHILISHNTSGGTWSVVGGTIPTIYVAASGDYYVTNTNACGSVTSNHIHVTVNPLPAVSFTGLSSDTFCITSLPDTLTGIPSGGLFSGDIINGNIFNPDTAGTGWNHIQYSYTDSNSCSNSISDSVYVDICTSINDLRAGNLSVIIYPNPANGKINIKGTSDNNEKYKISLLNTSGQVLQSKEIKSQNNSFETGFNLEELPAGIYYLMFNSDDNNKVEKIIKL